MRTVDVNTQTIAYLDEGEGQPVLMLHCSSSSHKEWSRLIERLKSEYRVIAPDLPGYGQSCRWPCKNEADALSDIRVVGRLMELADRPVHIIAHSYGAAMALESTRLFPARVLSLFLIEPVAFHLLREAYWPVEWIDVDRMARNVILASDSGRRAAAARTFMSFWIGHLRWMLMPPKMKRYIVSTIDKVAAECRTMYGAHASLRDYESLDLPVRLLVGTRTKRPARAVIEILGEVLRNVDTRIIPGAGHMSPYTHGPLVDKLAIEHLGSLGKNLQGRSLQAQALQLKS